MLYGIGHVLSKNVFHETPKSSMEQSFKAGYMIKLDKTFKSHETKFQPSLELGKYAFFWSMSLITCLIWLIICDVSIQRIINQWYDTNVKIPRTQES